MADADLLIEELSAYLKPKDVERVRAALEFSRAAHQGEMRQSGDPYISHPIAVARTAGVAAGMLAQPLGEPVEGPSKLDRNQFDSREDAHAENFRKMLLAMA